MKALAAYALCIVIAFSITIATELLLWFVLTPSMGALSVVPDSLPKYSQLFIFSAEHYVTTILIIIAACLGRWSAARKILFAFGASILMPALLLLLPLSPLVGAAFGQELGGITLIALYIIASVIMIVMLMLAIINAFSRSR